jgi:predicted nucleic acid-binding protein
MPAICAATKRTTVPVFVDTNPNLETACSIAGEANVSHWDALIVAAAIHQNCETLLSEDMQHGQTIEGVQIVNPFRVAA